MWAENNLNDINKTIVTEHNIYIPNKYKEIWSYFDSIKTNKNIFDDFFEKSKISSDLNISKEEFLKIVKNDFLKAITILIMFKNEQWMQKSIFSRWTAKEIAKNINSDFIKSKWIWQIRTTGFGKEELNLFFQDEKYIIKLLWEENKNTSIKLKKIFLTNKDLTNEQKIELLENNKLSTIFVPYILDIRKKRTANLLKKIYNIHWENKNLDKKDIFFYSTLLANSYHISPAQAVKTELFTNNILKIAEILDLYKNTIKIENRFWRILTKWIQNNIRIKNNNKLYKRNLELKKWVLNLIINNLDENKYNKKNLKKSVSEIKNSTDIPNDILNLVINLNKELNINVKGFSAQDYKNTDEEKAVFIWNYWPRWWREF